MKYEPCSAATVPSGVVWDVPPQHQGQHVTVAYARFPGEKTPACDGAKFKRVTDRSVGAQAHEYFRLLGGAS